MPSSQSETETQPALHLLMLQVKNLTDQITHDSVVSQGKLEFIYCARAHTHTHVKKNEKHQLSAICDSF